jgi:septum formation protein
MNLILASASPRRAELLRSAGLDFDSAPANVDEEVFPGEASETLVSRLSQRKAEAVSGLYPSSIILAADTVVEHDGEILGKPADAEEALRMLTALSGDAHEVMTGFTLRIPNGKQVTEVVTTEVEFRELTPNEIASYVESGEPMDKAGAYGIQSGAAGFVRSIRGSYTNVVGLPLAEVLEFLRRTDILVCNRDQGGRTP